MATSLTRPAAAGTKKNFDNIANYSDVSVRSKASSHDNFTTKYITVNTSYVEFLEEDLLLQGHNVITVNTQRDTSIILPDTLSYKVSVEIINNTGGYIVSVYSGY